MWILVPLSQHRGLSRCLSGVQPQEDTRYISSGFYFFVFFLLLFCLTNLPIENLLAKKQGCNFSAH